MKKIVFIIISLLFSIIVLKYFLSSYEVKYKLDGHDIVIKYSNKRTYYEIDSKFNFNIYGKRQIKKDLIQSITDIKNDNLYCVVPTINGKKYSPLCELNGKFTDYNLIDDELLNDFKKSSEYNVKSNYTYYGVDSNTFVALWNYKGYYIMNGDEYYNYEIFKKDKYDNSLAIIYKNCIYSANYDEEHEYKSIIKLDLVEKKHYKIDIGYNIDFDSYIVGIVDNRLYIFDNKNSILYELDLNSYKMRIKSSNEKGYVKYKNNSFISCSKSDYKVNKIKYSDNFYSTNSKYIQKNNNTYKYISDNKSIKMLLMNQNIDIIGKYNDIFYYIKDDSLYLYSYELNHKKIFYYNELNFNKNNMIFIYNG